MSTTEKTASPPAASAPVPPEAVGYGKPYTGKDKWIVSILSGLLFFLLASPFMMHLLNGLTRTFNVRMVDGQGMTTITGLLIMTVAYVTIARLLMR